MTMFSLFPDKKSVKEILDDMRETLSKNEFVNHFFSSTITFPMGEAETEKTDVGYNLKLEMPGFKKDEIKLTFKDGVLSVRAAHEKKTKNLDIELGENQKVLGSSLTDGILIVRFEKLAPVKEKENEIKID